MLTRFYLRGKMRKVIKISELLIIRNKWNQIFLLLQGTDEN